MKSLNKFLFSILGIGVLIVFYATSDLPFIYNIRNKPFFVSTNGEPPHQYYTFRSIKGIGVCDSAHNMIIPAEYKSINIDTIANRYYAKKRKLTYVFDANGQELLHATKVVQVCFSKEDFFYKVLDSYGDYGIIDQFGKEIVPIVFSDIKIIGDKNYYWFKTTNSWNDDTYECPLVGIRDKLGNVVIPNERFTSIILQKPSTISSSKNAKNTSNKTAASTIPYWFIVREDMSMGAYDIGGNEIIAPDFYTDIKRPKPDLFILKKFEKVGICKADGQVIIKPEKYDSIFIGGSSPHYWYRVYKRGSSENHTHSSDCQHAGVCDSNGRLIINTQYNDITYDSYDDEFYTKKYSSSSWISTGVHLKYHPKPSTQTAQTSSSKTSSSSSSKKNTTNNSGNIEYSYPCALCNGTGTQWNLLFGPTLCSFCGGTGVIKNTVHVDFSQMPNNYSSTPTPTPTPNYSTPSSSSSSSSSSGSNHATRVTKTETCSHCWGSGTCQQCVGKGWYYESFTSNVIECSTCDHNHNGKCRWCHGTGTVTKSSWEY